LAEHSAVTQRVGFTGARLRISRLKPDAGLQRTLERICEISAHALGIARVGVWLAEVEEDRLRCIAQYAEGVEAPPLDTLRISAYPQYCAAVLNNRFVAAADVQLDPRTKELAAPYLGPLGITSMLDAALYRDGRVIGVVCHESVGTRREWDTEERQFAATVADLTAYFMESHARTEAERKAHALQVSMLERDRLELIGRFATGVAHDLNNLIGAAQLNLKLLEQHAHDAESVAELATALEHAQSLARQLMAFQKGSEAPVVVTGEALRARLVPLLAAFLKPAAGAGPVTVRFSFSEGATFFAIPEQLAQVVINLVTNARDAMKDGGVVLLRARPCDEEPGFTQLDVIDTGTGISSEHVAQLFQPFFSTKGPRGTGLGLSLVHFIVGKHHGTVGIQSTPGDGTTVSLRWPAEPAHAA
jgi:signal transduction histidine kinase